MSDTEFKSREFAVYEDMPNWQSVFVNFLEDRGHKVSIIEASRPLALASVKLNNYRDRKIFAALIDGQLENGYPENTDGTMLLEAILGLGMSVHTISVASKPLLRAEFTFDKFKVIDELDRLGTYLSKIGA